LFDDSGCGLEIHISWARRVKDESDGVCTGIDSEKGVLDRGDSADFYVHVHSSMSAPNDQSAGAACGARLRTSIQNGAVTNHNTVHASSELLSCSS
jgi:hypothetical protein